MYPSVGCRSRRPHRPLLSSSASSLLLLSSSLSSITRTEIAGAPCTCLDGSRPNICSSNSPPNELAKATYLCEAHYYGIAAAPSQRGHHLGSEEFRDISWKRLLSTMWISLSTPSGAILAPGARYEQSILLATCRKGNELASVPVSCSAHTHLISSRQSATNSSLRKCDTETKRCRMFSSRGSRVWAQCEPLGREGLRHCSHVLSAIVSASRLLSLKPNALLVSYPTTCGTVCGTALGETQLPNTKDAYKAIVAKHSARSSERRRRLRRLTRSAARCSYLAKGRLSSYSHQLKRIRLRDECLSGSLCFVVVERTLQRS